MTSASDRPRANRPHIGIFGKRNVGKSTLLNALVGQDLAIVSEKAGTTADPVSKAMEVDQLGPVVFIDTAGIDDRGDLGALRVEKTKREINRCDLAIYLYKGELDQEDGDFISLLKKRTQPLIVLNKFDREKKYLPKDILAVNAKEGEGIDLLLKEIAKNLKREEESILGDRVSQGDLVVLVMPQDQSAPKKRLILPQQETIRELIDKRAITVSISPDQLEESLTILNQKPDLIITDSQVFKEVYDVVGDSIPLTSFSVLFAGLKGDREVFLKGARKIFDLEENSKVLMAEACTHAPKDEDIGRVKIPRMLRKKIGENLKIVFSRGMDFPENLEDYDLIIHCGACLFNKKEVMTRIDRAREGGVPITNYGLAIAQLQGILDKISL